MYRIRTVIPKKYAIVGIEFAAPSVYGYLNSIVVGRFPNPPRKPGNLDASISLIMRPLERVGRGGCIFAALSAFGLFERNRLRITYIKPYSLNAVLPEFSSAIAEIVVALFLPISDRFRQNCGITVLLLGLCYLST